MFALVASACGGIQPRESMSQAREVSFTYYEGTFMVVPVSVNGTLQKFILDTGIGVNLISKELCAQLGCKEDSQFSGKRMSGQEVHIPMSSVESLSMGGVEWKNAPVGIFEIEKMMPGSGISGFLSLGFFKELAHTVDYERRKIVLETPASLEKIRQEGVRVPVKPDTQGPSFGIHMPLVLPNGEQISAEVDTGSQALILNERLMKPLGISPDASTVKRKDGVDETGHRYARFFTSLQGSVHLPQSSAFALSNPAVMFQKIIYDGLVGHYFLSQFRVTYDLAHSEMIFRAP